jgi:opacity protein-like surface antigen
MGNVVFDAAVAEGFGIYGGAGLGGVGVRYNTDLIDPAYTATGIAAGGQVFAGASVDLAQNVSLFGEYRYQSAFAPVSVTDNGGYGTYTLEYARSAVLVGIKISK